MDKSRLWFLFSTVFLCFAQFAYCAPEKVSFTGADGVQLAGKFSKPASPDKWTLILLHGVGSVKGEWDSFFDLLSKNGYGVLIYDQRGHGESMKTVSGSPIDYQTFYARGLKSEWGKMIEDLGSAVQLLKAKYKINPAMVAVGGASIGANIALQYAASQREVPFVILLSPGIDYQGITASDAIKKYESRPLFMAVSPRDGYSYQSVISLQSADPALKMRQAPFYTVYIESHNQGHGVQMFKRQKEDQPSPLESSLLRWIQNQKRR